MKEDANIRIRQQFDEWGCALSVHVDCDDCKVELDCCEKRGLMEYEVFVGDDMSGGSGPYDLDYFIEKELQSDIDFNCDEKALDEEEGEEERKERIRRGNYMRVIQQILRDHKGRIEGFCKRNCPFPLKVEKIMRRAVDEVIGERSLN